MKRRGLLIGLAGLAGGAGCTETVRPSGPRTPPRSPEPTSTPASGLVVVDLIDEQDDAGNLLVRVTVENQGDASQSGTVVVDVRAGETETTVSRSVTLDPGERTEVALSTEIEYDAFAGDGSLQVDVQ